MMKLPLHPQDFGENPWDPLPDLPGHSSLGRLERVLRRGEFAVTAELNPPDSADAEDVYKRAAVFEGWKLKLCASAEHWFSDTVSAIMVPDGINGAEVIARAFKRYNLALGAGLSKVAGKLFRIGHLGDLNELMLLGAIGGSEMAMLDVGVKLEPGSGVAAAQNYWRNHSPVSAAKEPSGAAA